MKKYPRLLNIAVGVSLACMVLLPVFEIFSRLLFKSGMTNYEALLRHITLITSLLAAVVATRENGHISFVFSQSKPDKGLSFHRRFGKAGSALTGGIFSLSLAFSGLSFLLVGFDPGHKIAGIPIMVICAIIPLTFLGMGYYFFRKIKTSLWKGLLMIGLSVVFSFFISLPVVINLIYLADIMPPLWLENLLNAYYLIFGALDWPLIIILGALTLYGLPVFIFLGGTAILLFAGNWGVPEVIPNEIYNLLTDTTIPAIPLFTFAGFILSQGKSGQRLVALFQSILGNLPGGMAVMSVLICAFFTTFTGASGVTILALGGLLAFILADSKGYSEKFTKGLLTSSGSIGLLFPPSLPIIMYAVSAQISVKDMFVAGIVPGVLLVLALSIMGIVHNILYRRKHQSENIKFIRPPFLRSVRNALGEIMLPVVILSLYFNGITTLVETGAVTVAYVVILETVVFRELKWDDLKKVLNRAIPVIGGILIILAMAKGLSYFIVDAEVPTMLTAFLRERVSSPLVFILLLNLVLLVTGCFMDIYSAIMVVAPLIIPLGDLYGIHPVQLGIIFLANLQLGYLTPPVGLNLFLASYTFKAPLGTIYKGIIPFLLVLLLMVLAISYIPWISLVFIN